MPKLTKFYHACPSATGPAFRLYLKPSAHVQSDDYLWVLAGSDYNSNFVLPFAMHKGTLPVGTYTYVGTVPGVQPGHEIMGGVFSLHGISPLGYVDWIVEQGDTVTVNVIDNDGVYASGNFSAQFGPFTGGVPQGAITTGSFINALVYPY